MNILHIKRTPIAYAPDALAYMQTRYGHRASVNDYSIKPDIIHYHDKYSITDTPCVIQYHSPPTGGRVDLDVRIPKLVIAQYHATLPEYYTCKIVRNIIDIDNRAFIPMPITGIRVGFSPSVLGNSVCWSNKGYNETVEILDSVKRKRADFDYDIITGLPLEECLERKRLCNVIIDECMTSSYHRSALEGLAGGKMVICSLSDEVKNIMLKASGASICPIENVAITELHDYLLRLGKADVEAAGIRNRAWMYTYWNPKTIVDEFEKIYTEAINAHKRSSRNRPKP